MLTIILITNTSRKFLIQYIVVDAQQLQTNADAASVFDCISVPPRCPMSSHSLPAPPPPEDRAATALLPAPNGGATAAFSLTGNGRDSASAKLVFVAVALCPFVMCAVLYRRYRLQRRRRELIEIAMDDLRDGSER